jgi:enolase
MTGREPFVGVTSPPSRGARALRRACCRLGYGPGSAERARLLWKAGVHSRAAAEVLDQVMAWQMESACWYPGEDHRSPDHPTPSDGRTNMAGFEVADVSALEILDSRGRPTLAVTLRLADRTTASARVPSGASTGSREAVERRDGDSSRYEGRGVLGAAGSVNTEIADLLAGRSWASLAEVDRAMIDLDGTANKSRLGANATVGVSMALARALADAAGMPLWRWLTPEGVTPSLPVPHFNVLNGGVHAPNELDFQEFMVAPVGAPSMPEAIRAGAEVYSALRRALADRKLSTGLGDEGGFAPEIAEPEEVLQLLVRAIGDAGYQAGTEGVSIALDPAASEFRQPDGRYRVAGELLDSSQMIDRLSGITEQFPVHLIEDGLGEDDEDGWIALTDRLGATTELVGDDIFCTNPAIIASAIERGIGNASLIKLNQIGTVTETLEAMAICRQAGYRQFVSHRSGETEDTFIADLAVGAGCGHLKSGAPARGERVAKYNRLLEIAAAQPGLRYGMPPSPAA